MVSANGHVLKTVKGKAIGEVQIVDDKANVAVERGEKSFLIRCLIYHTNTYFAI